MRLLIALQTQTREFWWNRLFSWSMRRSLKSRLKRKERKRRRHWSSKKKKRRQKKLQHKLLRQLKSWMLDNRAPARRSHLVAICSMLFQRTWSLLRLTRAPLVNSASSRAIRAAKAPCVDFSNYPQTHPTEQTDSQRASEWTRDQTIIMTIHSWPPGSVSNQSFHLSTPLRCLMPRSTSMDKMSIAPSSLSAKKIWYTAWRQPPRPAWSGTMRRSSDKKKPSVSRWNKTRRKLITAQVHRATARLVWSESRCHQRAPSSSNKTWWANNIKARAAMQFTLWTARNTLQTQTSRIRPLKFLSIIPRWASSLPTAKLNTASWCQTTFTQVKSRCPFSSVKITSSLAMTQEGQKMVWFHQWGLMSRWRVGNSTCVSWRIRTPQASWSKTATIRIHLSTLKKDPPAKWNPISCTTINLTSRILKTKIRCI